MLVNYFKRFLLVLTVLKEDKETSVSACKQLPILVGETDNVTVNEVPRMVEGYPWKRDRGG